VSQENATESEENDRREQRRLRLLPEPITLRLLPIRSGLADWFAPLKAQPKIAEDTTAPPVGQ
jgi:hypothetical protein